MEINKKTKTKKKCCTVKKVSSANFFRKAKRIAHDCTVFLDFVSWTNCLIWPCVNISINGQLARENQIHDGSSLARKKDYKHENKLCHILYFTWI